MKIGMSLGMHPTGTRTQVQQAITLLRRLGTNAHVWAPGANGVSVASLPSNNYLLSDGSTGYSTVDGVDGLTLDGMGALSSTELVTNGVNPTTTTGFIQNTTGSPTLVASGGTFVCNSGTTSNILIAQAVPTVIGNWYLVSIDVIASSGVTGIYVGSVPGLQEDLLQTLTAGLGTKIAFFKAARTTSYVQLAGAGASSTATLNNIGTKAYSGVHASQPTTANRPLVRRGMLNELLNSASPATQSVTCIAAPYTLALYGTGNVVLSGTGAGTLTGTGASDLVVLNFTPTAGSVTFTKAGTVSSFGLFKGTWTAAQILAEGGIPTTTATAASNTAAGKYWWSFDGSNDSLLSGNLGITNACTIIVAGRVNSLATTQMMLAEDTDGLVFFIDGTTGIVIASKNGTAQLLNSTGNPVAAGVPFVVTFRLSGGTAVIRKNGVQVATGATALTFSAITGARIGTLFTGTSYPLNGALGWVIPLPTALSDADCLTVERLAASQFPNGPIF